MTAEAASTSLREAHKDLTRTRILDAAFDLLRKEDLDGLTTAEIAAAAGVTERTIYRHFATRDELLKALWPQLQKRVGSRFAETPAELIETPLWLFPNFEKEEGAVRASAFSRAGRELRSAVSETRKAVFSRLVRAARPDLDEAAADRLAAVVQLITGAYAWAHLKDFWGLSGAESGRAASEAIAALLAAPAPPQGETKP